MQEKILGNFTGIGLAEKPDLAKTMRKACGVGGTVKEAASKSKATNATR